MDKVGDYKLSLVVVTKKNLSERAVIRGIDRLASQLRVCGSDIWHAARGVEQISLELSCSQNTPNKNF